MSERKIRSGGGGGGLGRGRRELPGGSEAFPPGGVETPGGQNPDALTGDKALQALDKGQRDWEANLSDAERAAIATWTGQEDSFDKVSKQGWINVSWETLNNKLWNGIPLDNGEANMLRNLQNALDKSPVTTQDMILNKGITLSDANFKTQMKVGQQNVQLGVTNFTTGTPLHYGDGSHQINAKIFVPKGSKMAFISKDTLGKNNNEKEVLTSIGQRLRVDSITTLYSGKGEGSHDINMTFIPGKIF